MKSQQLHLKFYIDDAGLAAYAVQFVKTLTRPPSTDRIVAQLQRPAEACPLAWSALASIEPSSCAPLECFSSWLQGAQGGDGITGAHDQLAACCHGDGTPVLNSALLGAMRAAASAVTVSIAREHNTLRVAWP